MKDVIKHRDVNKNNNTNKKHNNINKINYINKNYDNTNIKSFINKNISKYTNKINYINKNAKKKYSIKQDIVYDFTRKELAWNIAKNCLWIGMVSILFYQCAIAFVLMQPLQLFMLERQRQAAYKQQKKAISKEFREVILSVSANLQAGYSVENAFCESYYDVEMLFGKESYMAKALVRLRGRLKNNQPLEMILLELAEETQVEDIREFADIFSIAKRSGGDMRGIISNTAGIIGDKIEVSKEIDTVMAEKQLEQKIMRMIPFAMIGYISITSNGYFDSLYHNVFGILIMTVCLTLYGVACMVSDKILNIEV